MLGGEVAIVVGYDLVCDPRARRGVLLVQHFALRPRVDAREALIGIDDLGGAARLEVETINGVCGGNSRCAKEREACQRRCSYARSLCSNRLLPNSSLAEIPNQPRG